MLKGTNLQATSHELICLARALGDAEEQQAAARDEEQQIPMESTGDRQTQTVDRAVAVYEKHQKEHNVGWQIPEYLVHLWLMTYALAYFAGYQGYRDRLARYRVGHSQRVDEAVVNYLVRLAERDLAEKNWWKWQGGISKHRFWPRGWDTKCFMHCRNER